MKNRMFLFLMFSISAICYICCENKESNFTDEIIVVGAIQKSNNYIYVGYLNKNADPAYNDPPYKPIKDAIVEIRNNTQNIILKYKDYEDETNYGVYVDENNLLQNSANMNYILTVWVVNIYSATTDIPQEPQILNIAENDTINIPIIQRKIYHSSYGIVDKGQIKFKISTTSTPSNIKSFTCTSISPYRILEYHTFNDSALVDFFFDTTANYSAMNINVSIYDSALTKNKYNNWTSDKRFIVFDSSVDSFYREEKNKTLEASSNILHGLGFFGSFNSSSKNFIAKIQR